MKIKDMSLLNEGIELDKYFQNVTGYTSAVSVENNVLYSSMFAICSLFKSYSPLLPWRVTMHISLLKTLRNPVVKKIICII